MTLKDSTHFTALSWELTKKKTIFTVDLLILTSKPIKWSTEIQTWVGQMHHICIHIFLEIDLLSQKNQDLISYKHDKKKKLVR